MSPVSSIACSATRRSATARGWSCSAEVLGEQRLSRPRADAVVKLLPDAQTKEEARQLLHYGALVGEEMLERELEA